MWSALGAIAKALLTTLLSGLLSSMKEKRQEASLTKLGYDQAQVERLSKEREVAKRAKEIHAQPTPSNIRDITNGL